MNGRRRPAPRGAELAAIAGEITEPPKTERRATDVIAEPGVERCCSFDGGPCTTDDPRPGPPCECVCHDDDEDEDEVDELERIAGRRRTFAERLADIDARIAKLQDERTTLALFELADRASLVPGAKPIARSLRAMLRAKMYPAAEAIALELDKRFPSLAGGR